MTLPYDYARCLTGDRCPRGETCLRWIEPGHPKHQSMAAFPPSEDCYAYLPNAEARDRAQGVIE